jgi:hypothetical protein
MKSIVLVVNDVDQAFTESCCACQLNLQCLVKTHLRTITYDRASVNHVAIWQLLAAA